MKRIVFVILIFVVVAIVGLFSYLEFAVPQISYVGDSTSVSVPNSAIIRRLYSSGVDPAYFERELTVKAPDTEFSEEEIMDAALKAGKPEFYPAFYFSVVKDKGVAGLVLTGKMRNELAAAQDTLEFRLKDVQTDITSTLPIEKFTQIPINQKYKTPLLNAVTEDKMSMHMDLSNSYDFTLVLGGSAEGDGVMNTQSVTLLFSYNIESHHMFSQNVLESQIMRVTVTVSRDKDGKVTASYVCDPYATMEDLEAVE